MKLKVGAAEYKQVGLLARKGQSTRGARPFNTINSNYSYSSNSDHNVVPAPTLTAPRLPRSSDDCCRLGQCQLLSNHRHHHDSSR